MPGMPDRKTWWRNLRDGGRDITLRLAGTEYEGRATALEGSTTPSEVAAGLAVYLKAMPRAAQSVGLESTPTPQLADLQRVAPRVVLVRIDLAGDDASAGTTA
jgi:hypothetical protein